MNRTIGIVIVSTILLGWSAEALACGEPLFKMGKGVRYRPLTAPLPARVLVYAPTTEDRWEVALPILSEGLRRAGHTVTEVADVAQVDTLLRDGSFDVVIGGYQTLDAVLPSVENAASRPSVLPVINDGNLRDPMIRARFGEVLLGQAEGVRRSCKVIQRLMEARAE